MNRNLDGLYIRILRNGTAQNVCFSDLTPEEREEYLKDKNCKWLKTACCHLADQLKAIGEQLDVRGEWINNV